MGRCRRVASSAPTIGQHRAVIGYNGPHIRLLIPEVERPYEARYGPDKYPITPFENTI